MLHSYAFMVSGLLVPVLAGIFLRKRSSSGAFWSMIAGGGMTLLLILSNLKLPLGLDANAFGISFSAVVYVSFHFWGMNKRSLKT
jgi:SSS family solute:Na+ symporter